MRDVKLGLARRDDRQGSRIGETDPISGAGVAVAVAEAESALAERSSSLPALKALLSRHKLLLAALGRSNRVLENENVRIERELAAQARDGGPASPPAVPEHDAPTPAASADEKLQWIENYLQSTLAQTLWALDARAARLEEQVGAVDREQARRLLDMTRTAYEQLCSLMVWLRSDARG
jgi:hypothetical protein